MSSPIFFAHANGFPTATYAKLLAELRHAHAVLHLERHAHDPRFPVDENWRGLLDELEYHLERVGEPVWGVGHSLGGVLHQQLARRRPALYRGVVMLDAPWLTGLDRLVVGAAKRFGFIDRITPAGRTLGRRETFADADQAHRYFASRRLFRDFDPDCLSAYVAHGLAPAEQGLRLHFEAATEIGIYRNLPHRASPASGPFRLPLALLYGARSEVVRVHHRFAVRRLARGETWRMPGGHMFPLEHPLRTAERLHELLQRWTAAA